MFSKRSCNCSGNEKSSETLKRFRLFHFGLTRSKSNCMHTEESCALRILYNISQEKCSFDLVPLHGTLKNACARLRNFAFSFTQFSCYPSAISMNTSLPRLEPFASVPSKSNTVTIFISWPQTILLVPNYPVSLRRGKSFGK